MFSIMNTTSMFQYGVVEYRNHDYIKRMINRDIVKMKDYYAMANNYVPYTNIFCKILNMFPANFMEDNQLSILREVDTFIKYDAKQLGVTSRTNAGFPIDDKSTYIDTFILFDLTGIDNKIKMLSNPHDNSAVKVLYNDYIDTMLNLPNSQFNEDIPVLGIDLNRLVLQYKEWVDSRVSKDLAYSPDIFVHKYILPSIAASQIDYSILNRVCNVVDGIDNDESNNLSPMFISDNSSDVDKLVEFNYNLLINNKMHYEEMLYNLKAITKESMKEILTIDGLSYNRQNLWVYVYIRIKYIRVLIQLAKKAGSEYDKELYGDLRIMLKAISRDSIVSSIEDKRIKKHIEYNKKLIEDMIGKR